MGLEGWKGCVREFLRTTTEHTLRDVAQHFNCPTGEIISAISEDSPSDNDEAGEYTAAQVQNTPDAIIEAAKHWGQLRCVVRSEAGAVSELMAHAADFKLRGDWLNIENPHFHLHVNWAHVQQAWFVRRGDKLCSVYFTNLQNETVFNLSLVRENNIFNNNALQTYEQDWQRLTPETNKAINELEKTGNE